MNLICYGSLLERNGLSPRDRNRLYEAGIARAPTASISLKTIVTSQRDACMCEKYTEIARQNSNDNTWCMPRIDRDKGAARRFWVMQRAAPAATAIRQADHTASSSAVGGVV